MAAPALRSSASHVLHSASAIVTKPVSGSHVLRIEGYSHLNEVIRHGECINSCDFHVGGHSWRLLYYPNGSHSKFRRHIAVYLQLASDPKDKLVQARPLFSLLDQLGNPSFMHDTGMYCIMHGSAWGIKDFIKRKELEKSEYLKEDLFAIKCDVSVTTVRKCSDHWAFISENHETDAA